MLVELTILPLGKEHLSDDLAEVMEVVKASGLPHQLTPAGTCLEGDWEPVMATVKACHDKARARSLHVVTLVKIEDEAGVTDKLVRNVASVEEKAPAALREGVVVGVGTRSADPGR